MSVSPRFVKAHVISFLSRLVFPRALSLGFGVVTFPAFVSCLLRSSVDATLVMRGPGPMATAVMRGWGST